MSSRRRSSRSGRRTMRTGMHMTSTGRLKSRSSRRRQWQLSIINLSYYWLYLLRISSPHHGCSRYFSHRNNVLIHERILSIPHDEFDDQWSEDARFVFGHIHATCYAAGFFFVEWLNFETVRALAGIAPLVNKSVGLRRTHSILNFIGGVESLEKCPRFFQFYIVWESLLSFRAGPFGSREVSSHRMTEHKTIMRFLEVPIHLQGLASVSDNFISPLTD
mmetsp:Transcript_28511/g.67951  ORF Transcript_28511/g.67951 Transcript_28511/m.67951 type:complete len:219 (+) Transcript_28511:1022-1678(+)